MRALIIGATGQDGRHLTDILRLKRFEVIGAVRHSSQVAENFYPSSIFRVDMTDPIKSLDFLDHIKPDYIFHLAAVHAPSHSMKATERELSEYMNLCHVGITKNILNWQKVNRNSRSLIALSSQMFRNDPKIERLITETSEPDSDTTYGISKRNAWFKLQEYREDYGLHTSGAILFNHTSGLSKPDYLFPTLVSKLRMVIDGKSKEVQVINELSRLDISHAKEVCDAMFRMLALESPGDFVLGSGRTIDIRGLLQEISAKIELQFQIASSDEPRQVCCLSSSPMKARQILNWETRFNPVQILEEMLLERQGE